MLVAVVGRGIHVNRTLAVLPKLSLIIGRGLTVAESWDFGHDLEYLVVNHS